MEDSVKSVYRKKNVFAAGCFNYSTFPRAKYTTRCREFWRCKMHRRAKKGFVAVWLRHAPAPLLWIHPIAKKHIFAPYDKKCTFLR